MTKKSKNLFLQTPILFLLIIVLTVIVYFLGKTQHFFGKAYELSDSTSIEKEGKLKVIVSEEYKNIKTSYKYILENSDTNTELLFNNEGPYEYGNTQIKIKGKQYDKKIKVDTLIIDGKQVLGANKNISNKTAVIMFNFLNDNSQPFTSDWIKGIVFSNSNSVKSALKEMSYNQFNLAGKYDLNGDVFGWFTIDANRSDCNSFSSWSSAAMSKANQSGIDLSGYNTFIFVYPGQCPGMAEMPGSNLWYSYSGQSSVAYTQQISHELMHTLGANHSNAYLCTSNGSQVAISNNCTSLEYASPYDILGNALFYAQGGSASFPGTHSGLWHVSAIHKARAGWLGSGNILNITTSGTYNLYPLESNSDLPQLIKIPIGGRTGKYYYLELRKTIGFDDYNSSWPAVNSVILYTAPDYNLSVRADVIDNTPNSLSSTYDNFFDGGIATGGSFSDATNGIKISVTSNTPEKASVQITLNSKPGSKKK